MEKNEDIREYCICFELVFIIAVALLMLFVVEPNLDKTRYEKKRAACGKLGVKLDSTIILAVLS